MDNELMTNEMENEDEGMTRAELEKFFHHLALFCRQCKFVALNRTSDSCKNSTCLLFMIRHFPELVRMRPHLLDKLLLQRRGLTSQPEDPRIRSSFPTCSAR